MRRCIYLIVISIILLASLSVFANKNNCQGKNSILENGFTTCGFFVKNVGQLDPDILYYADISSGRIYVRQNDIVFQIIGLDEITKGEVRMTNVATQQPQNQQRIKERTLRNGIGRMECDSKERRVSNVYVRFPDTSFSNIVEENELSGKINIFKGNNPDNWYSEIPTFSSIRIANIYRGVDLVLGGDSIWHLANGDGRRTNYEVGKDTHPFSILSLHLRERYREGSPSLVNIKPIIESDGEINFEGANIIVTLPFGGYSIPMPSITPIHARGEASDRVSRGAEDGGLFKSESSQFAAQQLLWGTYIGGSRDDGANALSLNSSDNIVISGLTVSSNIPHPNGYDKIYNGGNNDIYVAKLSSSGNSLLWGTYIGGSGEDYVYALSIDSSDNVVIAGVTKSSDIPVPNGYDQTYNGGYDDIYAAKLSSSGNSLLWGTYIGGSRDDEANALSLDSSGNIVISGLTWSSDIPVSNGYDQTNNGSDDIYVAKLSSSGDSLLWGTYIGGLGGDVAYALSIDSSNNVVITGVTGSSDIPVPNGYDQTFNGWNVFDDIYVAKLSSSGDSLLWGTYIGGISDDWANTLSLDSSDNVVIAGVTYSSDIPTPNGYDQTINGYRDIYVAKLSSSGNSLLWGTYIGGTSDDEARALSIDSSNNVVITGVTRSSDIPVLNSYDQTINGYYDIYVAKLSSSGNSLLWGTYIGGSDTDLANALSLDSSGSILIAGYTYSSDIPTPNGYDQTINGYYDIYVAKLTEPSSVTLPSISNVIKKGNPFKLKVYGSNFHTDVSVYIGTDTTPWSNIKYKDSGLIILKGGSALKARFSKGVPVQIKVVNGDGGYAITSYIR